MPARLTASTVTIIATLCFQPTASSDSDESQPERDTNPALELSLSYETTTIHQVDDLDQPKSMRDQLLTLELNYIHPFVLNESMSGLIALDVIVERNDLGNNQWINGNYVELEELSLGWAANNISAWAGRRSIKDSTSWWWDDSLLGAGLAFKASQFSSQLTAAVSSDPLSSQNVAQDPESESILMLLGSVQAQLSNSDKLTAFFSHQTDISPDYQIEQSLSELNFDERDDQLTWLGVRYEHDLANTVLGETSLLLDAAWMAGKSVGYESEEAVQEEAIDTALVTVSDKSTVSITGWSVNGWLSLKPPNLNGTELRAGYAYGSGTNRKDGSRTFRQTGLHNNEANTQYYGYITNPSLSNLHIVSLLISYPIQEEGMLFGQYNRYRRASTYDDTLEWDVDLELENNSSDIGYEISAGYEYEFDSGMYTELRFSRYYPGDAFDTENSNPINQHSITLGYKF